jgi:hypothetical protein
VLSASVLAQLYTCNSADAVTTLAVRTETQLGLASHNLRLPLAHVALNKGFMAIIISGFLYKEAAQHCYVSTVAAVRQHTLYYAH